MVETYTSEVTVPDLFEVPGVGLLDNVTWVTGDDAGHWRGGIQYDVDCPASSPTISACFPNAPAQVASKSQTWDQITRGARAFTVFDQWDCSAPGQGLGLSDLQAGRDNALRALSRSGPRAVERVFWTGDVANSPAVIYPHLNATTQVLDPSGRIVLQPSGVLITGTLDITEGVEQLEAQIASCYDGRAWLHVPAVLAAGMAARALIQNVNGKLQTIAGNRVIIGRGYPSTAGPNGTTNAAGVTQIWATSPVFAMRGTPRSFEAVEMFDRSTNTMHFLAEQTYLLGWHCCLAGVSVTTGGEQAGVVAGVGTAS